MFRKQILFINKQNASVLDFNIILFLPQIYRVERVFLSKEVQKIRILIIYYFCHNFQEKKSIFYDTINASRLALNKGNTFYVTKTNATNLKLI